MPSIGIGICSRLVTYSAHAGRPSLSAVSATPTSPSVIFELGRPPYKWFASLQKWRLLCGRRWTATQ
eukprot:5468626-Pyramimonas_sp.AAC.1